MKMIKITVDNEISVHEFPEGTFSEQNQKIREHIGPKCEMYEHVKPRRLYHELGALADPFLNPVGCVSMLVDEEGHYHDLNINMIASWLYETDKHGYPILGNVLIIGEKYENSGINFCGIEEEQFNLLYPKLEKMALDKGGRSKSL